MYVCASRVNGALSFLPFARSFLSCRDSANQSQRNVAISIAS